MSALRLLKPSVRVVVRERGQELEDEYGVVIPKSHNQVCAIDMGEGWGWRFYATLTGVELQVWDERPSRGPHPQSGEVEREQPYFAPEIYWALEDGKALYSAAIAAGIPLASTDAAELREALSRMQFVVTGDGVLCRPVREQSPPRKRRRATQKILDGGEDMTV